MTSHLKLVPKAAPSGKQAVIERVKAMPRPDGMLQCSRCGGRAVMTTVQGSIIKNGRYKAGTVIKDRVCYHCDLQGIFSPMIPSVPKPLK